MKVSKAMTADVVVLDPECSIQEAAKMMAERDIGAIPVRQGDRLVGMITDRDIAVRAVADGLDPDTRVGEVMSQEVMYCFEDDEVDDVAHNMGQIQVRRLLVVNDDKRLVGIVSLGDVAVCEDASEIGNAVAGISAPGGRHSQTAH